MMISKRIQMQVKDSWFLCSLLGFFPLKCLATCVLHRRKPLPNIHFSLLQSQSSPSMSLTNSFREFQTLPYLADVGQRVQMSPSPWKVKHIHVQTESKYILSLLEVSNKGSP